MKEIVKRESLKRQNREVCSGDGMCATDETDHRNASQRWSETAEIEALKKLRRQCPK